MRAQLSLRQSSSSPVGIEPKCLSIRAETPSQPVLGASSKCAGPLNNRLCGAGKRCAVRRGAAASHSRHRARRGAQGPGQRQHARTHPGQGPASAPCAASPQITPYLYAISHTYRRRVTPHRHHTALLDTIAEQILRRDSLTDPLRTCRTPLHHVRPKRRQTQRVIPLLTALRRACLRDARGPNQDSSANDSHGSR